MQSTEVSRDRGIDRVDLNGFERSLTVGFELKFDQRVSTLRLFRPLFPVGAGYRTVAHRRVGPFAF